MDSNISRFYGHRVRVRVCGLCVRNDSLVMVNHAGLTTGDFWSPPGGGLEFGQSAAETVEREFKEETGLHVMVGELKFTCEFINPPLHSIELFFDAQYLDGEIQKGFDPEMTTEDQIIKSVKWMSFSEISSISASNLHGIFKMCNQPEDILKIHGFWRI